jgi:hypothetical protein
MPSNARMTCCCRPITSSAGSCFSQADVARALTSGSAASLCCEVRKLNIRVVSGSRAGTVPARERRWR